MQKYLMPLPEATSFRQHHFRKSPEDFPGSTQSNLSQDHPSRFCSTWNLKSLSHHSLSLLLLTDKHIHSAKFYICSSSGICWSAFPPRLRIPQGQRYVLSLTLSLASTMIPDTHWNATNICEVNSSFPSFLPPQALKKKNLTLTHFCLSEPLNRIF